jgi:hypothetical protein
MVDFTKIEDHIEVDTPASTPKVRPCTRKHEYTLDYDTMLHRTNNSTVAYMYPDESVKDVVRKAIQEARRKRGMS